MTLGELTSTSWMSLSITSREVYTSPHRPLHHGCFLQIRQQLLSHPSWREGLEAITIVYIERASAAKLVVFEFRGVDLFRNLEGLHENFIVSVVSQEGVNDMLNSVGMYELRRGLTRLVTRLVRHSGSSGCSLTGRGSAVPSSGCREMRLDAMGSYAS